MIHLLLAQSETISRLGNRFEPGGYDFHLGKLFVLLGILVAIGVIVFVLARYFNVRDGQGYYSPRKLFRELCSAHDFDWRDRRLLMQIVRVQQLSQPARVFLEPQYLADAQQNDAFSGHNRQLEVLRERMFDE